MCSILDLRVDAQDLPAELETPDRPTSSGLQSPIGAPVQLGPSPQTREYSHPSPCKIPPAQWGDMHARDPGEEECELFGDVPAVHEGTVMGMPSDGEAHQDELDSAAALHASDSMAATLQGPKCVNGQLLRPPPPRDDSPSTACRPNVVNAPGGVVLGRGPPGFGQSPGRVPSRQIFPPPPPPPPPPAPLPRGDATFNAATYPREWTPLHARPKATGGGGPPDGPGGGTGSGVGGYSNPAGNPCPGGGSPGSSDSGGAQPPGGGNPGRNPGGSSTPPGSTPPQQTGGAGNPGGSQPTTPPGIPQSGRYSDPWAPLDRSGKTLPKLSLPSNYKNCSILDMQQILEAWYDKSTFAIATWRGDAQRY